MQHIMSKAFGMLIRCGSDRRSHMRHIGEQGTSAANIDLAAHRQLTPSRHAELVANTMGAGWRNSVRFASPHRAPRSRRERRCKRRTGARDTASPPAPPHPLFAHQNTLR